MSIKDSITKDEIIISQRTVRTLRLNTVDLESWMKRLGVVIPTDAVLPKGWKVEAHVEVPSGGDWSSAKLDLSAHELVIVITHEIEKRG